MPQRQVVEISCCRCDRKEYREPSLSDPITAQDEERRTAAFSASLFVGDVVANVCFDDLCTPCANTVRGHLAQIAKKIEGVSPMREKKEKPAPVVQTNGSGAKEKHARG